MGNIKWKSRYNQEVELMTYRAEKINKKAVTTVRKITPEEEALLNHPKFQYTVYIDKINSLIGDDKHE